MEMRLSQLQDEQVDHLRLDRIKIQRKRMEHIFEIIKDLTFKNKELIKQNIMLKDQIEAQRVLKHSFQDFAAERKSLTQKNLLLEGQLRRCQETMLQQQLLIRRLQQQVSINNVRETYAKEDYYTEPNFAKHLKEQYSQDQFIASQDYEILKAQYKDLQKQYSKLFQSHYSKEKQNVDTRAHVYSTNKDFDSLKIAEILKRAKSYKDLEQTHINNDTINYLKMREKYDKVKKQKKQLIKALPILESEITGLKLRQQNLIELVDILKSKKTKICRCHINKLQKQLELKATILQNRNNCN